MKGDSAIIFLRENKNDIYSKVEYKFQIRTKGQQLWSKHKTADVAAMYISLLGM